MIKRMNMTCCVVVIVVVLMGLFSSQTSWAEPAEKADPVEPIIAGYIIGTVMKCIALKELWFTRHKWDEEMTGIKKPTNMEEADDTIAELSRFCNEESAAKWLIPNTTLHKSTCAWIEAKKKALEEELEMLRDKLWKERDEKKKDEYDRKARFLFVFKDMTSSVDCDD